MTVARLIIGLALLSLGSVAGRSCAEDFELMLTLKLNDSLSMIDATGKSAWDLGKYDQCRDLGPTVAQYCYVQYPLSVHTFPVPGALGICAPASCNASDVHTFLDYIYQVLITPLNVSEVFQNGTSVYCIPPSPPPLDGAAIATIVVVAIVAALTLGGTAFDYFTSASEESSAAEREALLPPHGSINQAPDTVVRAESPLRRSLLGQLALAFSITWNIERLHQPHPDRKTACLNGLRVFSMFWVILGHSFLYGRYDLNHPIGYQNLLHVFDVEAHKWTFQLVFGAELAVDTFFYLSGFLVTWGALDMLFKSGKLNLVLYYFHRIWRLTPVYAFMIMIFMNLEQYFGDGPAWSFFQAGCEKWWANILYITDFYPTGYGDLCFGWGWYLSIDFHFYILTPILLFPFYWNKYVGYSIALFGLVACWVVNAVVTNYYHLSYYPVSDNFNQFADKIYNKPWTRMGPYLIGVMFAFFLQGLKQAGNDQRRVPFLLRWLIYVVIGALLLLPVYGTHKLFDTTDTSYGGFTNVENILYISFARSGWALGVGLLSYLLRLMCYWGYGGIVRWILERDIWTPMARLTYLAYLVHPMILIPIYGGARSYHVYSEYWLASKFAGNVALAYAAAFAIWLMVEKPTMNLEKFFLPAHGGRGASKGNH